MLESIFLTVNEWMVSGTSIAAVGCLAWGMISVLFSPCHLASIPLVVAYVGGQEQVLNPKQAGVYSSLFTLGHCLPIVVAGSSTGAVRKLMENSTWQGAGTWFRRAAGVVIILLGVYFILNPLILS